MTSKGVIYFIIGLMVATASLFSVAKTITIKEGMKVGDSQFGYIDPTEIISASPTSIDHILIDPKFKSPDRRIHFALNTPFRLKKIVLSGGKKSIDQRLYFMIWNIDNGNELVVNTLSNSNERKYNQTVKINKVLEAGTYKMAVVGQCYDGSDYIGWKADCDSFYGFDDFFFNGIKLKGKNVKNKVNHYRILHPTSALTCDSESITIQACSNAPRAQACKITPGKSITINKDGRKWKKVNLASGSETVDGLTSSLGITSLSLKNNPTYCNGSRLDAACDINFTDLGLKFSSRVNANVDIPNQTSGDNTDGIYLRALKNDGSGTCKAIDLPSVTFELAADCKSPSSCGSAALPFKVSSQELGKDSAPKPVSLNRVAMGVFQLNDANYGDAGQIQLTASYDFGNSLIATGISNAFWVKPDHFTIDAIGADGEVLNNTSATTSVVYSAAKRFTLKLTAMNAQNETTRNYQPSTVGVIGELTRNIPSSGGRDGIFQYALGQKEPASVSSRSFSGFKTFSAGVSEFTGAYYDDAGVIHLNVSDKGYPGGVVNALGGGRYLGRFIPDRFELVPENSEVTNYVTDNDDRANDFTYLGQDRLTFDYQVKAVNFLGSTTENYPDLTSTPVLRFYAENRPDNNKTPLAEIIDVANTGSWSGGLYTGTAVGSLARPKDDCLAVNNACGPFNDTFFGLNMVDDINPSKQIVLANYDMYLDGSAEQAITISKTASRQVYGRWSIADDYGPTGQQFPVTMRLEYYDGNQFSVNADDSGMPFNAIDADATFGNNNIGLTGSGTFENGMSTGLLIDSHSNTGVVDVEFDVPTWLEYDWDQTDSDTSVQNPEAIITFGLYHGTNNVLYRRKLN